MANARDLLLTVMDTLSLIHAERCLHEYDAAHDDQHTKGELAMAAIAYASPLPIEGTEEWENYGLFVVSQDYDLEPVYPFTNRPHLLHCGNRDHLPTTTRIRQLVVAGSLICAEIERLQRVAIAEVAK